MKEGEYFPPRDSKLESVSLRSVLERIHQASNNYLNRPRSFLVEKTVNPDDLHLISRIRIEIALMRDASSGHLILTTGSTESTIPQYRKWYQILGSAARAAKRAEQHHLEQQYASTVHLHNHPVGEVYFADMPISIKQNFRSPGGDKLIGKQANMEVAMIVVPDGVLVHKDEYVVTIPWNDRNKLQLICDVINGKKSLSEIKDGLASDA